MKLHRPKTYWRIVKAMIYGAPVTEPAVRKVVEKIHGRVFVDIGANIGMYSIPLSANFEKVYSFEPNSWAAGILREKAMGIPNIRVLDEAVSDELGEARLYKDPLYPTPNPPTGSASTILDEWHYKPSSLPHVDILYHGKDYSTIKTTTLDSFYWYYLNNVKWLDLVKIDVEGAEFLVLKGASRLLKENLITRLVVEIHDRDRKQELATLLNGYGYEGRWLDTDHYYAVIKGDV